MSVSKHEHFLGEASAFAAACRYEKGHSHQVARLALLLFDELKALHGLKGEERFLLHMAAVLHDIGWLHGQKAHHKSAREMIMASTTLTLSPRERTIIALIARYHRKSLPKTGHKYYDDLDDEAKEVVRKLSALLRIADGLDYGHCDAVRSVTCRVLPQRVVIHLAEARDTSAERAAALKKADLFKIVFGKDVALEYGG